VFTSLMHDDVASTRRLAGYSVRMSSCAASGTLRGGVSQQGSEVQYNPLARRAAGLTCGTEDESDDDDDDEPISRSVSPSVRLLRDMHTVLSSSPHSTARTQAAALRAYYSRKRYANQARARALHLLGLWHHAPEWTRAAVEETERSVRPFCSQHCAASAGVYAPAACHPRVPQREVRACVVTLGGQSARALRDSDCPRPPHHLCVLLKGRSRARRRGDELYKAQHRARRGSAQRWTWRQRGRCAVRRCEARSILVVPSRDLTLLVHSDPTPRSGFLNPCWRETACMMAHVNVAALQLTPGQRTRQPGCTSMRLHQTS
jgi:hypothetical protein